MRAYILFFVGCLLLSASSLFAEDPNFSVTIVGSRQYHDHYLPEPHFIEDHANQDKGVPYISVPERPQPGKDIGPAKHSGAGFYVVIRNISKNPIQLNLLISDWYDCLEFQLTAPDGKVFQVKRSPRSWFGNDVEPWIFQPNDIKVFTVDFTDGEWDGLPPKGELTGPQSKFKIKATFRYPYKYETISVGNVRVYDRRFDSDEIEAYNGP